MLAEGGAKTRIANNVAALDLLRTLESEGRNATAEEKHALAKYVGWGGLPQLFDEMARRRVEEIPTRQETLRRYEMGSWASDAMKEAMREEIAKAERWRDQWAEQYDRLKEILTPDEWRSAQESIINAHYTSPEVIRGMWAAVERLGVKGGNILEPAGGVGHFFGAMPQNIADRAQLFGVELDSVSGRIFSKLYPEADVEVTGYQDSTLPENSMDLVISNVPFANFSQSDPYLDSRDDAPSFSLHNYFFEKALRSARPGGIVAFITTAHTMDSQIAQRKWIAERADFLGAIRLPNNAFKGNANTEVTTDIIFLRKPDGSRNPVRETWTATETVSTPSGPIQVNEYFLRNPDMVLGELTGEGSMHGGDKAEMTVVARPGAVLPDQLAEAVAKLPENVSGDSKPVEVDRLSARLTGKPGSFWKNDRGDVEIFGGSSQKIATKDVGKIRAFMTLRDTLNELYAMESDATASNAEVEAKRKELNTAYERFTMLYKGLHEPSNMKLLRVDPDFYRVLGLEAEIKNPDAEVKSYRKADVFSKRVMRPKVEPTTAGSLADAITLSLRWKGRLDTSYVARLLGQSLEQVEAGLLASPTAFRDPVSGMIELREAYLSGNIRRKIRDAEIAAARDGAYQRNLDALKGVMPEDVPWGDIDVKMGSTWVPPEIFSEFLNSLWGDSQAVEVIYHEGHGQFIPDSFQIIENTDASSGARAQWGTNRKSPKEIADALLNMRGIRVTDTVPTGNGKSTTQVFNPEATEAAREVGRKMRDAFLQWVSQSQSAQERMHKAYNEKFNSFVVPKFDGSHMELPWVADSFDLYPQKKDVVWRGIQQGNLLVAHGVGGGKTIIGTALAIESKRLGLANKPLIVVHNATLEQFAETISQMAPTSKVLVARKEDLAGPKRKEFMGRIASGDWDAVVMAHSTFEMIPDDPAWESRQMNEIIEELNDALREMDVDPTQEDLKKIKDPSAKELVKMRKRLRDKLSKLQERATDNVLTFQELGIDMMIVDEAHLYKKLPFVTKQSQIAGIDTGFSKRAAAVHLRANWIRAHNKGRGVFTMTGTPVTNTLGESWNAIRLVRPDLLEEFGVKTFDRFVSTFADIEESGELRPNGKYKAITRLSKMANIPEWNRMWLSAADVKMGDDMSVKGRPEIKGGRPQLVAVEKTAGVGAFVEEITRIIEEWEALDGAEKRELSHIPMLTYNFSRAAAVDIRLINPDAADEAGSKVNAALESVAEIYKRTDKDKGTQVIFSDIIRSMESTSMDLSGAKIELDDSDVDPNEEGDGRFNLYEDMKRKLHEKYGIPLAEIALATDAKNDKQREAMFAAVNEGKVRIIIGSTSKLGTGVNMQQRMIAAHHLDVPWTPAELEQRDGRVYRQGNMWGPRGVPVEIYRYGMKDTLDAALWQKLETKERFIKQAVSGKQNARVIEDDGGLISLAEQKAILSGAEGLAKFNLDESVRQLRSEWRGAQSRRFDMNRAIKTAADEKAWNERNLAGAEARAKELQPLAFVDPATVEWSFAGGETLKGEEARAALDAVIKERRKIAGESLRPQDSARVTAPIEITANGVPLILKFVDASENTAGAAKPETRWNLKWKVKRTTDDLWFDYNGRVQIHPASILGEALSLADRAAALPEGHRQAIKQADVDVANLKAELAKPFDRQAELEQAVIDQAVLYEKMGIGRPLDNATYAAILGDGWEARLTEASKPSRPASTEARPAPRGYPGAGLAPEAQETTLRASAEEAPGDFSAEKAEVLKTAPRGKDGHPLAPNGKRSNLTEDQWATVRTRNFKRWFGDWEVMASTARRDASTFREARDAASTFQGKSLVNRATGTEAMVSRNNLDKMLNQKSVGKSETPSLHSLAVANADWLFEAATYGWSKPDKDADPNITAIHRFFAPLVHKGEAVMVKLTVKETAQKGRTNPLYTVEAVELNKASPAAEWVGEIAAADGIDPRTTRSAGDVENLARQIQDFNPEIVSKVVDENGEPMVVWHGGRIFDEFRKSPEAGAHFASSDMEAAQTFADQYGQGDSEVKPMFLRILNPSRQEEMPRSGDTGIETAKQAGHDGILARDTDASNRGEYESFAFWDSTQAKSAGADFDNLWGTPVRTESNNGDFSENPSILRASPDPGPASSDAEAAVEAALAKMPEIYRQVFEAVNGGTPAEEVMRRFDLSPKAVENILNAVRSRIETATRAAEPGGLKPAMKDGKLDGGRPAELALRGKSGESALDEFARATFIYGGQWRALTNSEARAVLQYKSLVTVRDRILAGRPPGNERIGGQSVRFNEAGEGEVTLRASPDPGPAPSGAHPASFKILHFPTSQNGWFLWSNP